MDFSLRGLVASFVVSSIGFVLFRYGKQCGRMPQLVSGLSLMLFPLLVPSVAGLIGIAAFLLAGLWVSLRCGL